MKQLDGDATRKISFFRNLATLVYTHMVNFEADSYNTLMAINLVEWRKLVEASFEFVTRDYYDGGKILKKE